MPASSGEVQVGEQHLALAQAVVFRRDGLLDLEHQVGLRPTPASALATISGAGGHEVVVGDRRAGAGAGFDEHLVPAARRVRATPAGVMATRYSWFLTSAGTPIFMMSPELSSS